MFGTLDWKVTARAAYESAEYRVIESDGEYDIREYPDLMLVSTKMKLHPNGNDGSSIRLFRYIIWTVVLFAFVGGVLTLATPLAVESLVNVVSRGTYVQPLIVLGMMLLMCLGIAGVLQK